MVIVRLLLKQGKGGMRPAIMILRETNQTWHRKDKTRCTSHNSMHGPPGGPYQIDNSCGIAQTSPPRGTSYPPPNAHGGFPAAGENLGRTRRSHRRLKWWGRSGRGGHGARVMVPQRRGRLGGEIREGGQLTGARCGQMGRGNRGRHPVGHGSWSCRTLPTHLKRMRQRTRTHQLST